MFNLTLRFAEENVVLTAECLRIVKEEEVEGFKISIEKFSITDKSITELIELFKDAINIDCQVGTDVYSFIGVSRLNIAHSNNGKVITFNCQSV